MDSGQKSLKAWTSDITRRSHQITVSYDALGRRVLVRTRRDGLCHTSQNEVDCTSGIERFMWAGDNILWEMRGPGDNTETADRLEVVSTTGQEYGIVGYTHAGGTSTTPVEWPGFRTTANHSMGETQVITKNWMGSLLEGQRDAGGQMYMRNRYYDPATGQFTQTDPIGIAGGLNTYGFAAGDPVSYADPYGLSAESCPPAGCNETSPATLEREVKIAENATATDAAIGAGVLLVASGWALAGAGAISASLWKLPPVLRGVAIEARLGANLPANFPVIDRFVNGIATSIKSIDLSARSYQTGGALLSRLTGYARSLGAFEGATHGGASVTGITQRVLQVAIPDGATLAQTAAIREATARAAQMGVRLITTVIK